MIIPIIQIFFKKIPVYFLIFLLVTLFRYRDWDCGDKTNCNGAIVRFVFYNQSLDPFSRPDSLGYSRISDIVEIQLRNPHTGKPTILIIWLYFVEELPGNCRSTFLFHAENFNVS